jgi:hypothetical protein
MKPSKLAESGSEHGHQAAFFCWCRMATNYGFAAADDDRSYTIPLFAKETYGEGLAVWPLQYIHAIPNGGSRGDSKRTATIAGVMLKAEGVKKGISDVFLPFPFNGFAGLYIEFKKPDCKPKKAGSKGGLTDEQIEFLKYAEKFGYKVAVCYHYNEAINVIKEYLK